MILGFDEINKLGKDEYFKRYFGEMELPEYKKEDRIELSEKIYEMMIYIFSLISTMIDSESIDVEYLYSETKKNYEEILDSEGLHDTYLEDYIDTFSRKMIDTTLEHIENGTDNDREYYMSSTRAIIIGTDESNTIYNYESYKTAIDNGCTMKEWISERDERVRKTHLDADGSIVEIGEPFVVGTSLMMFPKDSSLGADASEIANCRCTVKYY